MAVRLFRHITTAVWFGLVLATLTSWSLGVGHQLANSAAGALILLIAFVKVRFVGRYFMELRHAPIPLLVIFEGWTLVVAASLVGLLLYAP